jgi:hypothetical protein
LIEFLFLLFGVPLAGLFVFFGIWWLVGSNVENYEEDYYDS